MLLRVVFTHRTTPVCRKVIHLSVSFEIWLFGRRRWKCLITETTAQAERRVYHFRWHNHIILSPGRPCAHTATLNSVTASCWYSILPLPRFRRLQWNKLLLDALLPIYRTHSDDAPCNVLSKHWHRVKVMDLTERRMRNKDQLWWIGERCGKLEQFCTFVWRVQKSVPTHRYSSWKTTWNYQWTCRLR